MPQLGDITAYPIVTPQPTDLIPLTQSGTVKNALVSSLVNNNFFNIKNYGAVGNGIVNDSAAIQAAANAAGISGGILCADAGIFNLGSTTVTIPANIVFRCAGPSTVFKGTAIILFQIGTKQASTNANVIIEDLTIDGSGQGNGNTFSLRIDNCSDVQINRCRFPSSNGFAIFAASNNGRTTQRIWIQNCYLYGHGHADTIGGGPNDTGLGSVYRDIFVDHNYIVQDWTFNGGTDQTAINMVGVEGVRFTDNITYGGLLFGTEQQPHLYSKVNNNIVYPAIGATSVGIGFIIKNTATLSGDLIQCIGNTIKDGFLDFNNTSVLNPKLTNITIANNTVDVADINSGLIIANCSGGTVVGNVINNSPTDGMLITNSTHLVINSNYVSGSGTYGIRSRNGSDYLSLSGNKVINSGTANYLLSGINNSIVVQTEVNGFVGINQLAPNSMLHIVDNANPEIARFEGSASDVQAWEAIYKGSTREVILGYGGPGSIFNSALTDSTGLRATNALHLGSGANIGMTLDTTNRIGIGVISPTAYLHIKSGAAAVGTASFKLNPGVNLTTPEDGAIEYDGTHFYATIGSIRYPIDQSGLVSMTTAQRNSVSNPSGGYMIYNSTENAINIYTDSWQKLTTTQEPDFVKRVFDSTVTSEFIGIVVA